MIENIAVEGLKDDIVPIIIKILKKGGYNVSYSHETPYMRAWVTNHIPFESKLIQDIIDSKPDLTVLCNANGYLHSFLEQYCEMVDIPSLVLTGGGPDLEEKARKYTPHVLGVPLRRFDDLYRKIEEIESLNDDVGCQVV